MDMGYPRIVHCASYVFDAALAGALFVAPCFMGGRGPLGKFIFVLFVIVMAFAWLIGISAQPAYRRTIQWTGAEWIFLGGLLLVIAQLIPLPEPLLLAVSPHLKQLLPVWLSSTEPGHVQIGQWKTISLAPEETRRSLAVYVSYGAFLFLLVQRIRTLLDAERLMRWIAMGTIALASIGLAQFLAGNGKYLWLYEHPFRDSQNAVKGPFQNQNHFAHMMALGIGPLLCMTVRAMSSPGAERRQAKDNAQRLKSNQFSWNRSAQKVSGALSVEVLMLAVGVGLVATSAMLTFSRGGIIAFVLAAITTLGIYRLQGIGTKRMWLLIGGTTAVVFTALLIHGYDSLSIRLATLRDSQSLEELSHGRRALWSAMTEAITLYWRGGTGLGSHSEIYSVFMEKQYNVTFTHGESGYLQLLMESGIGGIILFIIAAAVICRWIKAAIRNTKIENKAISDACELQSAPSFVGPVVASIIASLVHSLGDFVWYITAPMSWTIVSIALASILPKLVLSTQSASIFSSSAPNRRRRSKRLVPAVSPQQKLLALDKYQVACLASVVVLGGAFAFSTLQSPALAAIPWNKFRTLTRQVNAENGPAKQAREIELLRTTIAIDPNHHEAMQQLLAKCAGLDTNEVFVSADSKFGTDVNDRAKRARLALTILSHSPTSGFSYLALKELIEAGGGSKGQQVASALVEQTLRVDGHSPQVRLYLGKYFLSKGQIDEGFKCWKIAFQNDLTIRRILITQFSPIFPAETLVEKFDPDIVGLRDMLHVYSKGDDSDSIQWLTYQLIDGVEAELEISKNPSERGNRFFELFAYYRKLNEHDRSLHCLEQAINSQPNEYRYRRELPAELIKRSEFKMAADAVRWCQARRPDDRSLDLLLQSCVREQLASNTTSGNLE